MIPTRQTLLSRLRNWDDQEGWREFFDTYWKLIYGVARQSGLAHAEAEDVVQETILSVAKQMPEFKYDRRKGTFKSWLLLVTKRRITDHLRKRGRDLIQPGRESQTRSGTQAMERVPDPASLQMDQFWETEWEKTIVTAALRSLKGEVDPKHFQIFHCYAIKAWSVEDVVQNFGVSASQVYLIKHRLSAALQKIARRLEHAAET